jgi:hypothetical protein
MSRTRSKRKKQKHVDTVSATHRRVPMSEVLSALSYALDMTEGQPKGHSVRSCMIGMRIGKAAGLDAKELAELYYALLLKDAGCSANASRIAVLFGSDDQYVKPRLKPTARRPPVAPETWRAMAKGNSFPHGNSSESAAAGRTRNSSLRRAARRSPGGRVPEGTALAIQSLDEH